MAGAQNINNHVTPSPAVNAPVGAPAKTSQSQYDVQQVRINYLEQQIQEMRTLTMQPAKVDVSVADMNAMYSNHLDSIDFMLGIAAFVIIGVGGIFGWIGYRNIKKITKDSIERLVIKETSAKVESAILPLRQEYEKVVAEQRKIIAEQERQENQILAQRYFSQANSYFDESQYQAAIVDYDKAIELDPTYVYAYGNRGSSKFKLNQYKEAIKDFDKAIVLDSAYVDTYYNNRVSSYIRLGLYQEAIVGCDKTIELDPMCARAYYNRACVYALTNESVTVTLGGLAKAIELDKKFIKMAQTDEDFESIRDNAEFRELVGL